MKVVILCGGKGERMGEISAVLPKPLIPIGSRPILWHLMKVFKTHGFNDFILCLGYKGDVIQEYFSEYGKEFNIQFVETGLNETKSQRIAMVERYIDDENFFISYGDDLCDVDLKKVLDTHIKSGRIVTITAVRLTSPYGVIDMDDTGKVLSFQEKPVIDRWINGGFMVANKRIFDHLREGELEDHVFKKLVNLCEIGSYKHSGTWKSMTTLKDNTEFNELWSKGKAFWKIWDD